tara:strand:+ start:3896 stop:4465 length:570 start_codon:yes stop_codon:yes gene_type:complete
MKLYQAYTEALNEDNSIMKLLPSYEVLISEGEGCPELKITDGMRSEILQYKSDEEFLRAGGLSMETLDRAAHGFSEGDITTLNPDQLKIRWVDDLDNVKWEIRHKGLSNLEYAKGVDLSEPIDVEYWEDDTHKRGFYISDGHHRYYAAKILNKPLNVSLEIKVNPISILSNGLGYDDYHKCLYRQIHNL